MKKRLLTLSFVLFAVIVLAGCSTISASSWPGVTYDSSTDAIYVAFNSHVVSVDPATGKENWRFPAQADRSITFFAPPAITSDGQVIAGGYDQKLYSINAQTGTQNWVFEGASNRYIATPLVVDDKIFAPNADERMYALTTQNEIIWETPFEATQPLWGTPGINAAGDTLFLTSMDRNVYAVDIQTGETLWSKPMEGASVGSTTVSEEGDLFVGNFANQLLALASVDGSDKWSLLTDGWVWSGPLLLDDLVIFGDLEGTFYAVNRESGSVDWQIKPDGQVVGQPVVLGDRIYFGTESGTLYVVDLRGNIVKSVDAGGSIYSAPVATDDLIIVAPYQNPELLVAYDADGNKKWGFTLDNQ